MTGYNLNSSEGCALFQLLRVGAEKCMSGSVFQSQPNYILVKNHLVQQERGW